jgi:NAD(P)-dependent dehydrogenase (short-subunit alcohol dehydrogenase family)
VSTPPPSRFHLTSRTALVTGAGRSVGEGIARELAAAGARVAVNDLHADRAEAVAASIRAAGGQALAAPFDVTDAAALDDALAGITAGLGPVDVLVNNAGVPEGQRTRHFLETDEGDWLLQIQLNLVASMRVIRAVLPGMVERGWGRVVQISSGASSRGLDIGVSAYGAAKSGIEGLVRHVATEVGPSGVTVNALALGLMENVGQRASGHLDALVAEVPVRRLGLPAEVGGAVVWLSSAYGAFVTGQVIHLNGGALNGR